MAVYSYNQGAVQVANTQYIAYDLSTLTAPLQLVWPVAFQNSPNVVANFINVTGSVTGDTSALQLPIANQVSVGTNFQVLNSSAHSINVLNYSGAQVATALGPQEAGSVYTFLLADNSDPEGNGTWIVFDNASAATSAAQAGQLAGQGLLARGSKLNLEMQVVTDTSGVPFNVTTENRADLVIWKAGGGGIVNLPPLAGANSVSSGFYFALSNLSAGVVNLTTPDPTTLINTSVHVLTLNPGDSAFFTTDGTSWASTGLGQPLFLSLTQDDILLTGTSVSITALQQENEILNFIGSLTAPCAVTFIPVVYVWYIYNNSGAAITMVANGSTAAPIPLPDGERIIIYCDGVNLYSTPTILPPGTLIFPDGSAAEPSITFSDNTTTGAFLNKTYNTSGNFGISQAGDLVCDFSYDGDNSYSIINLPDNFALTLNNSGTTKLFAISSSSNNTTISSEDKTITLSTQDGGGVGLALTSVSTAANLSPKNTGDLSLTAITSISLTAPIITATVSTSLNVIGNTAFTGNVSISGTLTAANLPSSLPVPIAQGGTGQTTALNAFNALLNPQVEDAGSLLGYGLISSSNPSAITISPNNKNGGVLAYRANNTAPYTGQFFPLLPALSILQVVTLQNFSLAGYEYALSTPIPGFTLTITPKFTNSKILILASAGRITTENGAASSCVLGMTINNNNAIYVALRTPEQGAPSSYPPLSVTFLHAPNAITPQTINFQINQGYEFNSTITIENANIVAIEIGGF